MDKFYLIALNAIPTMGSVTMRQLLEHYHNDAAACWEDYRNWRALPLRDVEKHITARESINADACYEEFLHTGADCVTIFDDEYPALLKEIYDPPYVLFYKGELPYEDELCMAVIGSRHATAYGRLAAEMLSEGLGKAGISIVSGMARGIDTACHKAALKAGAKTYAVLGSGIDVIYPRENDKLYHEIAEQGAVISYFPCGAAPLAKHFPQRNRIISGMSKGIVVVEAGEKSGTLITVSEAINQNRDIWAVPGPITATQSRGTNKLLKQGCKLVTCAEDILEEYFIEPSPKPALAEAASTASFSVEEKKLLDMLIMPMQFDVIASQTGKTAAELSAMLTMLELQGAVQQLPGKFYISIQR